MKVRHRVFAGFPHADRPVCGCGCQCAKRGGPGNAEDVASMARENSLNTSCLLLSHTIDTAQIAPSTIRRERY